MRYTLWFLIISLFINVYCEGADHPSEQSSSGGDKKEIETKKATVKKILGEKFIFEGLPTRLSASSRKEYLKKIAIALLDNLVTDFPDSPYYADSLNQLGMIYFEKKQYKESLPYFKKYVSYMKNEGKSCQVWYNIGIASKAIKDLKPALSAFYKVLDLYPDNPLAPEAYKNIAECYRISGNKKKLIRTYENVAGYFTDKDIISESWIKVARIQLEMANYSDAIWNVEKVVNKYKDSKFYFEALYLLGVCYGKTNDRQKEREVYTKIIADRSFDNTYIDEALFTLGDSFFSTDEFKEASIAYYTAISRYPESPLAPDAVFRQARCYIKLGLPDLAIDNFKKLLSTNLEQERKKEIKYYLGEMYFSQKKYQHTLNILEPLFTNESPYSLQQLTIIYYLGMCNFYLKRYRLAFDYFLKLEYQDDDLKLKSQGIYMLGRTLQEVKKFESSTLYFKTCIDIADNFIHLVDTLSPKEMRKKGIISTDKGFYLDMKQDAFLALGRTYFDSSDFKRAVDTYKMLVNLNLSPYDRAWVLYQIAKCYENIQDYKLAEKYYTDLVREYPEQELAKQAEWELKDIQWKNMYSKTKKES